MSRQKKFSTRRLVFDGLLAAIALTIFIIELQLPPLTPIPGIKTGFSNIITLMALFLLGPADALFVMLVKIVLCCFLSGQLMALIYSLAGGLLSFLTMFSIKKLLNDRQIFICSVFGALMHNVGQLTVAALITKTGAVFYYLPILIVSGIIAGFVTGLAAQFSIKHVRKLSIRFID